MREENDCVNKEVNEKLYDYITCKVVADLFMVNPRNLVYSIFDKRKRGF